MSRVIGVVGGWPLASVGSNSNQRSLLWKIS
jgi:hypothetical protein